MHFDCAGLRHKTAVLLLVPAMTILQELHVAPMVHGGFVEALVGRCCEDRDEILSLHDLVQILMSGSDVLYKVFA